MALRSFVGLVFPREGGGGCCGSSRGDGALNLRLKLMLDTPFSSIPLFLAPNNPDYRLENPPTPAFPHQHYRAITRRVNLIGRSIKPTSPFILHHGTNQHILPHLHDLDKPDAATTYQHRRVSCPWSFAIAVVD